MKKANNTSDEYLIEGHPDKGCELSNKCIDCPYIGGSLVFRCKCKSDYANGVRGMVTDIKSSVMLALLERGVSVTILSRVFNMKTQAIRTAIHRYVRRKDEN